MFPSTRLPRFIPAVLWAGVIYWLSSLSQLPAAPSFPGADKAAHAAAYAALTLLLLFADHWRERRAWLWVMIACLYGVTDELHQMMVPPRDPSLVDWLADAGGALLAAASALYVRRRLALAAARRTAGKA